MQTAVVHGRRLSVGVHGGSAGWPSSYGRASAMATPQRDDGPQRSQHPRSLERASALVAEQAAYKYASLTRVIPKAGCSGSNRAPAGRPALPVRNKDFFLRAQRVHWQGVPSPPRGACRVPGSPSNCLVLRGCPGWPAPHEQQRDRSLNHGDPQPACSEIVLSESPRYARGDDACLGQGRREVKRRSLEGCNTALVGGWLDVLPR